MNKFLLMAVAAVCALPTMAQKADSLVFTTVLENPVTSIKNQNNSGTCWSYSALAFLESEVLKKDPSKKDIDLCESYVSPSGMNVLPVAGVISRSGSTLLIIVLMSESNPL